MVNLHTNTIARILGKVESNDRFLRIALYQGDRSSKRVRKIPAAAANVNESKEPLVDPTLLCCAFKKHRLYLFRYVIIDYICLGMLSMLLVCFVALFLPALLPRELDVWFSEVYISQFSY